MSKNNGHNAHKIGTPIYDVDEELSSLRKRSLKLKRLIAMRLKVAKLESEAMRGLGDRESIKVICELVCQEFQITLDRLQSRSRQEYIAVPRMLVFYLAHHIKDLRFAAIARIFAKDHGTVIHGCKSIQDRMSVDRTFRERVERLEGLIDPNGEVTSQHNE